MTEKEKLPLPEICEECGEKFVPVQTSEGIECNECGVDITEYGEIEYDVKI